MAAAEEPEQTGLAPVHEVRTSLGSYSAVLTVFTQVGADSRDPSPGSGPSARLPLNRGVVIAKHQDLFPSQDVYDAGGGVHVPIPQILDGSALEMYWKPAGWPPSGPRSGISKVCSLSKRLDGAKAPAGCSPITIASQ